MKKVALFFAFALVCAALEARGPRPLFRAAGEPISVGDRPSDIAVADINRDGHLDLLTANSGSNDVSVLLGDSRGGFRPAPGSPLAGGPVTHLVAAGDENGDQKLDLAVTSHDSNDVIVYLGDGRGSFRAAPGSPFALVRGAAPHNHGLGLGDLNGDSRADLATSNQNARNVSVLLSDGQGGFDPAPGSPFSTGGAPYPLALGDVNGDGALDIAVPNLGGNSVAVLLNNGHGGFAHAPGSPVGVAPRPYFLALGDLNDDAKTDLVVAHDDITQLTVLLGDGRGSFRPAPSSPLNAGYRAGEVLLADLNTDGRLDIVTGTDGNNVVVLLGDGRGGFASAPGSPFPTGHGPWGVAVADINRDAKPDILMANFDDDNVKILLGN